MARGFGGAVVLSVAVKPQFGKLSGASQRMNSGRIAFHCESVIENQLASRLQPLATI